MARALVVQHVEVDAPALVTITLAPATPAMLGRFAATASDDRIR